jgi:hypothetical protein
MTNAEYFAGATDVFLTPRNPVPVPVATIVAGMMAVQLSETTWLHTGATRIYHAYHNVDQSFKKVSIDAFEDLYINVLSDEIIGYANCTSRHLLFHLLMYYVMIAPTGLTQNYEHLNTSYDPHQSIESLF